MWKLERYKLFQAYDNCYQCTHDIATIDIDLEYNDRLILELWCGSGSYAIELAKLYPKKVVVWVDMKSDRLFFGAKKSKDQSVDNIKFVRAQVDHLDRFIKSNSVEEIRITFPDPRLRRDRQKLTSSKYLDIYKKVLLDWGIINIKTDSKEFYDFSIVSLEGNGLKISKSIWDIYDKSNDSGLTNILKVKTYYESKWLKEWRQIWYIKAAYQPINVAQ